MKIEPVLPVETNRVVDMAMARVMGNVAGIPGMDAAMDVAYAAVHSKGVGCGKERGRMACTIWSSSLNGQI